MDPSSAQAVRPYSQIGFDDDHEGQENQHRVLSILGINKARVGPVEFRED